MYFHGGDEMARPRKRKLSDTEFKKWLLNAFIDDNGDKISVTNLLQSNKLEEVGLSEINKDGKVKPCSRGTITYWCKVLEKNEPMQGYRVCDESIYKWGIQEGLIDKSREFEKWTNVHNLNGTAGTKTKYNNERIILNKISQILGSNINSNSLGGDLEVLREFLVKYFGVAKFTKALESLGVEVNG